MDDQQAGAKNASLGPGPSDSNGPRRVGIEFRKCLIRWQRDGLMERYLSGQHILDIGYKGRDPEAVPITDSAIGIGLDFPGYDGTRLPFDDRTQDAVFASAVLEHIPNYKQALSEWYRVTKIGGYLIIFVPNRYLYEMRPDLPGRWNGDHRRFYTAGSLLQEIEEALPVNGFRVRHLLDNDEGFNYSDPQGSRPRGNYQIETVVEKIEAPTYSHRLIYPDHLRRMIEYYDKIIIEYLDHAITNDAPSGALLQLLGSPRYFTPWRRLQDYYIYNPTEWSRIRPSVEQLKALIRPILDLVEVDADSYVKTYRDLEGHRDPALHWRHHGYFEGRLGSSFEFEI